MTVRVPTYCTSSDIADWIRIAINPNTDPNTSMVDENIMDNEDRIDRLTGHTWLTDKLVTEEFSVNKLYDWGRGMPLFPRKRNLKTFDSTKGDKFEIWDGGEWSDQTPTGTGDDQVIYFQEIKGVIYLRGYLFTILRTNRFRVTYRYGGDNERIKDVTEPIPRDIKKACKLMTCMDILSTDFQMSQIAYGGEGNIDKNKVMDRWQTEIDQIIWSRSEITSTW
jgi:hypothetical protein